MILVIGGAYQGKLDYVKKEYNLSDEDVFSYEEGKSIETDRKVIYGLEKYSLSCVKEGLLPEEEIRKTDLEDKIVIVNDISCGIVPMDKTERAWREGNGRMVTALALKAEIVIRVFCGIPCRLK